MMKGSVVRAAMSDDSNDTGGGIDQRALIYSRYGLRIFPVKADEKRPMPGYGWIELASSQTNHVVEDFMRAIELWGEDNVSVAWALGLDGYMAVDLDVDEAHWPSWVSEIMASAAINVTKRGTHLIFKMPEGFECGNGTPGFPDQGWGEVRGKGGYIVIAGPDRPGLDVTELDHSQPFPYPTWLSEYGGKTDVATKAEVIAFANEHAGTGTRPNKIESIRKACADWNPVFEGDPRRGRHPFAVWAMTCAAEDAQAGYYNFMAAHKIIKDWWKRVTPAERHGREFDGIVTWAVGRALSKAPTPTVSVDEDESPGLSLIDGIRPALLPLDWSTFRSRERHVEDWLVEGFWPRRRAMLTHAKAGTGKSELALYVASCLALGCDPWTGYKTEPIRVAYFDFEMDEDQVDDRLNDLGFDDSFNLADLEDLRYFVLPPIAKLDTAVGAEMFLGAIEHERAEAVIIDTFSRVITTDENEATTVQRFYEFTGQELKRRGIGQWRIDHTGKDATKGARGSSAKNEDVDFVWDLRRTDDNHGIVLKATKQRSVVDTPLTLQRLDDPFVRYQRVVDISTMAPGADVTAKVYQLEELGIDSSWGFDKVRNALLDAGAEVGRKTTLQAAIRWRREAKRRGAVIAKGQVEPGPGLRLVDPVDNSDE
jgi:hypothetical protein